MKISRIVLLLAFLLNGLGPLPAQADGIFWPVPGSQVSLSPSYNPPILTGLKVHPDDPFRLDFILDEGYSVPRQRRGQQQEQQSVKLIKYFLAALTVPEKDLWVNLSPYEKNRIVPDDFGQTEMGRDVLAEDYILKQVTASLVYPEGETGKKFWQRVYEESVKRYGTTEIPINSFNKVWITPDKAVVYENAKAGAAYVVKATLKVMLEEDYLSLTRHSERLPRQRRGSEESKGALSSQILRQIIIPELTKEVNEGRNFAQLRQVYNSLILADWYKKKIKDSILEQVYRNKSVILSEAKDHKNEIESIYHRYLQAFKKGVYNYIKEIPDPLTGQTVPRKYFSGGAEFMNMPLDYAMASEVMERSNHLVEIGIGIKALNGFQELNIVKERGEVGLYKFLSGELKAQEISKELGHRACIVGAFNATFRFKRNGFRPGLQAIGIGPGEEEDFIYMVYGNEGPIVFERHRAGKIIATAVWVEFGEKWKYKGDGYLYPFWAKIDPEVDITDELGKSGRERGTFNHGFRFEGNGFQPGVDSIGFGIVKEGERVWMRHGQEGEIFFERRKENKVIASVRWRKIGNVWVGMKNINSNDKKVVLKKKANRVSPPKGTEIGILLESSNESVLRRLKGILNGRGYDVITLIRGSRNIEVALRTYPGIGLVGTSEKIPTSILGDRKFIDMTKFEDADGGMNIDGMGKFVNTVSEEYPLDMAMSSALPALTPDQEGLDQLLGRFIQDLKKLDERDLNDKERQKLEDMNGDLRVVYNGARDNRLSSSVTKANFEKFLRRYGYGNNYNFSAIDIVGVFYRMLYEDGHDWSLKPPVVKKPFRPKKPQKRKPKRKYDDHEAQEIAVELVLTRRPMVSALPGSETEIMTHFLHILPKNTPRSKIMEYLTYQPVQVNTGYEYVLIPRDSKIFETQSIRAAQSIAGKEYRVGLGVSITDQSKGLSPSAAQDIIRKALDRAGFKDIGLEVKVARLLTPGIVHEGFVSFALNIPPWIEKYLPKPLQAQEEAFEARKIYTTKISYGQFYRIKVEEFENVAWVHLRSKENASIIMVAYQGADKNWYGVSNEEWPDYKKQEEAGKDRAMQVDLSISRHISMLISVLNDLKPEVPQMLKAGESNIFRSFFAGERVLYLSPEEIPVSKVFEYKEILLASNIATELHKHCIDAESLSPVEPNPVWGKNPAWYKRGYVQKIPAEDNRYDSIIAMTLFDPVYTLKIPRRYSNDYYSMYREIVHQLKRVLKDGGKLLVVIYKGNAPLIDALNAEGFTSALEENPQLNAMIFINHKAHGYPIAAMNVHRNGGIDLTSAPMTLQAKIGNGIKFHIDPAQLTQYENASNLVPVIISEKPLVNLQAFLGIVNQAQ